MENDKRTEELVRGEAILAREQHPVCFLEPWPPLKIIENHVIESHVRPLGQRPRFIGREPVLGMLLRRHAQ